MKKLRIGFVFSNGRLPRVAAARKGDVATEFFYGALELEYRNKNIEIVDVDNLMTERKAINLLQYVINQNILPSRVDLKLIVTLMSILEKLNKYDVIVGTTSAIALALGFLQMLGLLRKPVIGIHCSLLNYPQRRLQRKLMKRIFTNTWSQIFGKGELYGMLERFEMPRDRIEVNQFGVDTKFWHLGNKKSGYVLSVGNDGRRDYETLINAAESIPWEIKILTSQPIPELLPDNVSVIHSKWHTQVVSDAELRTLYQEARCVVVPLKESFQPSGQSVSLQAMACGTPVVITKTSGLWSKEMMQDGYNVVFTKVNDSQDMADKINQVCGDSQLSERLSRAGRETVEREATIELFADRVERLCQRAILRR